ncbi:MAG: hypothetical protein C4583_17995 [Anaerolineaceae bacterium]|nr:MAG: hypothetical protein C4583_17995 [Anaerolineaceae bacterium]
MKEFISRIGTFFFLMGIGLFVLFIASDIGRAHGGDPTNYTLLCGAVTLFMVGFLFRRAASPPEAAERFRYIRRIQERREASKKEKNKEQKK